MKRMSVLIDGHGLEYDVIPRIYNYFHRKSVSEKYSIVSSRLYRNTFESDFQWNSLESQYNIKSIRFPPIHRKYQSSLDLILDTMLRLHSNSRWNLDGVVIVSSLTDYSNLIDRLHQHGLFVIGIGSESDLNTPLHFKLNCSQFITFESLSN